jgi:hypothetical protein
MFAFSMTFLLFGSFWFFLNYARWGHNLPHDLGPMGAATALLLLQPLIHHFFPLASMSAAKKTNFEDIREAP